MIKFTTQSAHGSAEKIWTGRTRSNKIVLFEHRDESIGDLIQVRVTQPQTWILKGEIE